MSDPTFNSVTVKRSTGGAAEDLLTLDSVDASSGNGAALRFVNNSAGTLSLALGRISIARVNPTTVRLDLSLADDPSLSGGDATPALLSLLKSKGVGASSITSITTAVGSTLDVGGLLNVSGATTLSSGLGVSGAMAVTGNTALTGALSVSGITTLNGGLSVSGAITITGSIDGRDVSADGARLDTHLANTANPHNTTATQVGALPLSGGTLAGNLSVDGAITITGSIDGRDVSADGARLDTHLANLANPHGTTAAQVGALPLSGGTLAGNLNVSGEIDWGNGSRLSSDQGGSIELGNSLLQGTVPFIDFHYGVGAQQDFNVRLINNADHELVLQNGSLRITGDLTVGAGGNQSLKVRHIDGKDWQSDNNGELYLNWNTGRPVVIGFGQGTKASLTVSGDLGVGTLTPQRTLDVNGDIQIAAGHTFYSPGRMHIHGEEKLYLLNKAGVIISKSWSDPNQNPEAGDLSVEGALKIRLGNTWWRIGRLGYSHFPNNAELQQVSDARLKQNIQPLSNALEKISRLRGVSFQWSDEGVSYLTREIEESLSAGPGATAEEQQRVWDAERARQRPRLAAPRIGLLAQEVAAVIPEVVCTDEQGFNSIMYSHLTALLIEALKEQATTIQALTTRVCALETS